MPIIFLGFIGIVFVIGTLYHPIAECYTLLDQRNDALSASRLVLDTIDERSDVITDEQRTQAFKLYYEMMAAQEKLQAEWNVKCS